MIHYQLRCRANHSFEGWFRDSATFEKQAAAREIACPSCDGTDIDRAPMAPRLAKSQDLAQSAPNPAAVREFLDRKSVV